MIQIENLKEWIHYILETYHNPLREDLVKIQLLLNKIVSVHGEHHPEFAQINTVFWKFKNDMIKHLHKEENVLFPMLQEIQNCIDNNKKLWWFHCGSIQNPISQMEHEHDIFDTYFEEMSLLSNKYEIPSDACNAYTTTYKMLEKLEKDTREHATFENDVLFKVALEKEKILNNEK